MPSTIAYVAVVGDLFHFGHLRILRHAAAVADLVICGVLTDEAVELYRSTPVANLEERLQVIESIRFVDRVLVQADLDPTSNLKSVHLQYPQSELVLVHGSDWLEAPGATYVEGVGGRVIKLPYYSRLSRFKVLRHVADSSDAQKDVIEFDSGTAEFGSKALRGNQLIISTLTQTLAAVVSRLWQVRTPKSFAFSAADWEANREQIIESVIREFPGEAIWLRSSNLEETIGERLESNESHPAQKVEGRWPEHFAATIDCFFKHHVSDNKSRREVLVQEHLESLLYAAELIASAPALYPYSLIVQSCEQVSNVSRFLVRFPADELCLPIGLQSAAKFVRDLRNIYPSISLEAQFGLTPEGDVSLFSLMPLQKRFVHAWGGRTSIQSLECHTLRYLRYSHRLGNAVHRALYCEIRAGHHVVYFDARDVARWEKEGRSLLDQATRETLIGENLRQIDKYDAFVRSHVDDDFSSLSNEILAARYEDLLSLIMENGSFFPYSRPELITPIWDRIYHIVKDEEFPDRICQLLTTPTSRDIFVREREDRLSCYSDLSAQTLQRHAFAHSWRFINTYDESSVIAFLRSEISESSEQALRRQLRDAEVEREVRASRQEEVLTRIGSSELRDLSKFLQDAAVIRLENKRVWSGYEYQFLNLFKEISKRVGLAIDLYLQAYRIEDTLAFLREGLRLPSEDLDKRGKYWNFEIADDQAKVSYIPRYGGDLSGARVEKGRLRGQPGNLGRAIGRVRVVVDDSIESLLHLKSTMGANEIYVTTMTHPAMVSLLASAAGIITDEGGVTSHAAVIARELNIPCLVGTRNATRLFVDGDIVELDVNARHVRKLSASEAYEFKLRPASSQRILGEGLFRIAAPKYRERELPYIYSFSELGDDHDVVGNKARNLACLGMGYSVPKGIVVSRRLHDEILQSYFHDRPEIPIRESGITKTQHDRLDGLRASIVDFKLPEEFCSAIELKIGELATPRFAVRSAASCEDSKRLSFAGQFETYLSVERRNIAASVLKCIASAYETHVLNYILSAKFELDGFFMSVIIQEFLPSEKAGVFFSVNPNQTGDEGVWIEANFGVGESVVGGAAEPDRYLVGDRHSRAYISKSKKAFDYTAAGMRSSQIRDGRVLNDEELQQLRSLAVKLRTHFGTEVECEWAYLGATLYVLQVRPMTSSSCTP
ncbi:MAG: adenylyltransferase/cytidyltransferase family protein [Bdellovibrionales bacterium]|nr:adenylyltransferase/cytidyltransferase family protein [Bdellovibrionales bacterium]